MEELKTVNLYIDTSIRGAVRKAGAYGYVLERQTNAGPATFTMVKRLEETTEKQSLCVAIKDALGHLRQQCFIYVYTDSPYIKSVFERGWLQYWKENEWKNKKGLPVADADKWMEVADLLVGHQIRVEHGASHEYRMYLQREVAAVAAGQPFTPL